MESRSSSKLMFVCLVILGLLIPNHTLVWGMNKADLVDKMAGEAGISTVYSNSLSTADFLTANQGPWLNHPPIVLGSPEQLPVSAIDDYFTYWSALPPYNFLWPLWSPALVTTNPTQLIEPPLLIDLNSMMLLTMPPVGVNVIPLTPIIVAPPVEP